jgi:hypothetical protein
MRFKFFVTSAGYEGFDGVKIYAFERTETGNYYLTLKDGVFERHPLEEGCSAEESFMTISGLIANELIPALVEGLAKAGYVAEVDNAQRLAAEATSKERKDEIEWLRSLIEKQLGAPDVN